MVSINSNYVSSIQNFQSNTLLRNEFPKGTPDHAIELWSNWPDNVPAPGQEINKEYLDKKYPAPKPKFQIWGGLVGFPVTDPVKFRYQMLTHSEEKSRHFFEHFVKNGHKHDYNVIGGDKFWNTWKKISTWTLFLAYLLFIPTFLSITIFNRSFLYQNVIKGSIFDQQPQEEYKKVRRDDNGRYYIGN